MQRVTISIDDALATAFDADALARGYHSRSEAVRDLMREAVRARSEREGFCVASFSYVFNHHERGLAARLMAAQHAHHDLVLATTHVHLDHDHCLEAVMLRGPVAEVRALTDAIQAERGVRHGTLNLISVTRAGDHDQTPHAHHVGGEAHTHFTPLRG